MTTFLFLSPVGNESRAGHTDPDGERSRRDVVLGHLLREDGLVPRDFRPALLLPEPGNGTATGCAAMHGGDAHHQESESGPVIETTCSIAVRLEPHHTSCRNATVLLSVVKVHRCLHPWKSARKVTIFGSHSNVHRGR